MKVFISQSNYIPWKGFFDAIQLADAYVLYDEMQYTKQDWRNRNQIKTAQGLQWLSIPVKMSGRWLQKINEVEISNPKWTKQHWKSISQNYRKAPFFSAYGPWCEALYQSANQPLLSQVNHHFLQAICELLQIETPFYWSADFDLPEDLNEKLLYICKQLKATHYISGPAARSYLDESLFQQHGISIIWLDYSEYPEYTQLYPPFTHSTTVLDLIFNVGPAAASYLKYFSSLSEYSSHHS